MNQDPGRRFDMSHVPTKICSLLTAVATLWLSCAPTPLLAQQSHPGYPGYPMPLPYGQPGQPQPYSGPGQPYMQPPQQRQPTSPPRFGAQQPWQQTLPTHPQSTPRAAPSTPASKVDMQLSESRVYVQQTLLLTLDVISGNTLANVETKLPPSGSLVLTNLEGPTKLTRNLATGREFIHQFRYAVTPLKAGQLRVPAITIEGVLADANNTSFKIDSPADRVIEVLPINPAVQPWLPLFGLSIQSYIQGTERPEVGKPFRVVVDTSAVGATGGQLPSFAERLQNSSGFNVYREESRTEGSVSSDGRFLLGRRTESFTLVPQQGGKLLIPELQISWWNATTGQAEVERFPMRQLIVKGEAGSTNGAIPDLFPGASSLLLWVPLTGLFSLTIGFWVLAWLRKKRFAQVVEEEVVAVTRFSVRQFREFLAWLAPIRRLQKVRQIFVRTLPRRFKLWFCIKVVEGESDPETWSYMLKFLSNKHLQFPPQLPLQELGERLAGVHTGADRMQMQVLMGELDKRLYAEEKLDFAAWKRRFRAQLRPTLLPVHWKALHSRQRKIGRLPRLNPEF